MKILALRNLFAHGAALLGATLALVSPLAQAAAPKSTVRLPSIYAFNVAAEATINLGTTTSLNWSVGDATTVTLAPGFGDVTNLDSIDIAPTTTTTYVLTATNAAGTVSASKKITVIIPPVIQTLTATPTTITAGASAKLSFTAPGADYFTITADNDADPGNVFGNSVTVKPRVTTTYTVVAVNTAGTDTRTITLPVTLPPPKPTITSFTAIPSSVASGNPTILSWAVNGATSLSISPGIGAITGTSIAVTPTATTTYTLTATNPGGSVTKKVTVTVTATPPPPPAPVIASFAAQPASIVAGNSTTLSWSVTGATSLSISPGVGAVTGTSVTVAPTTSTTFVLTATNAGGSVTQSVNVTVTIPPPPAPVIASFAAQPASIVTGNSTTLSWVVVGATSLSISPSVGTVTGTSVTVSPTTNTTFVLTATNAGGSVTKSVDVTVTVPLPVIGSFTASPGSITTGGSSALSWSVTGATSLSIAADVGASPGTVTGTTVNVSPTVNTTYTLTATNATGSVTKTVTVGVNTPLPVISSFTASPATITKGDSTTLAWSVTGADTLTITPAIGNVFGTSIAIKPPSTVAYVLTATNAGGSVTKIVTVTVNTPVPLPVIGSFTATPGSIVSGNATSLAWSVSGADSLSITADTGASPGAVTGTSLSVSPTANTTYTLTATNITGSVTKTVSVAVTNPVPPPVISFFTALPTTIAQGGSSTLSWSVTGATSLIISSDVGASPGTVIGASGTVSVSPSAATNYTLTARNDSGAVTQSVRVTVNDPAPVISSFASIPNTINSGDTARIIWSVTGAATLNITASHGPSPGIVTGVSGSINVTPTTTTDYTLTATSPGGVVSHSLTEIQVRAAPPQPVPVIASFAASPDTISLGAATTLTWSITGADSVSIAASVGTSPGAVTGTSLNVSPAANTVYTITATNSFGNATATADVTVTGPTAPVIGSFGASPAFIQSGMPSTLNWTVSGADSISIAADVGPSPGVVTGTSLIVSPTVTTSYTLTATNAIGSTTAIAPVTLFTPGTGSVVHPHIWVTPASAATLNTRAAANDPAWIRLRDDCDAYVSMTIKFPDEDGTDNSIAGGYQYNDYLLPSEDLALGYVAAKTADPTRAARYAAKERQLLLALSDPVHHGVPTTDSGYSIRSYVPALAIGYDWIFETLSDADRVQIYTEINRWVTSYEAVGFGRDYPTGNYFAGYYCAKPLAALATEGENPQAPAMWNDWLNRVHYGMVQPYYASWLSGGGAPDGWNYGPFETINMIRPMAAAFTAKGLDLIHDSAKPMSYHDGHARWMTQFTWPDMKTVSDRGFVYNSDNPTSTDAAWATQFNGLLRLANGSNAPIMQRYTLDLRAMQGTGDVESWAEFLLHSNSAPVTDFRTQLSYRTNGDGQVAMRSSWATDAVWGAFQSGPFTGFPDSAEELPDEGALTIQRGSVQFLVNTWGAMMRDTPGTSDGDPVFDDLYNELFQDQTDGVHAGRRIFNTYYAVRPDGYWGQIGATPFDGSTTTLSRFEEGGGYVLMRGTHLENQYFDDSPIGSWTRNVAYVRPQLFVVYDRTAVKNASADNWMAWHVGPAPTARTDAAAGTHAFDVIDTRAAFGGNLFRGRVTTVLPAGNVVNPVDVFGRGKVFRLEVRNASPVAASTWLTVFDASASASAAASAAPLTSAAGNVLSGAVEGTVITGATGHNVAVLFSKAGTAISGAVSVVVPATDTFVLVNDLQPNAGYVVTATAANGNFTLQFVPGGTFMTTANGTLSVNVSAAGAVTLP